MNEVNKTLYIPLYGKAYVSKRGLFISDKKAEEIWNKESFTLKGKSKSKWLAYYMGIRSAVFDEWLKEQINVADNATILHIGCGLDSRVLRVSGKDCKWYDIDFPQVIEERRLYYSESDNYKMISGDARSSSWLENIPQSKHAIIVMEGISMYLNAEELSGLMVSLCSRFEQISLLVDCYTVFGAKMSRIRNPINDVGVTKAYGIDNPELFQQSGLAYVSERTMIPQKYINELKGIEKLIFSKLYAGGISKKIYKLFECKK